MGIEPTSEAWEASILWRSGHRTCESWLGIPDTSLTFGMALTSSVSVDGRPNRYSSKRKESLARRFAPQQLLGYPTGSSFSNTASRNSCRSCLFSYLLFFSL